MCHKSNQKLNKKRVLNHKKKVIKRTFGSTISIVIYKFSKIKRIFLIILTLISNYFTIKLGNKTSFKIINLIYSLINIVKETINPNNKLSNNINSFNH